MWAWFFFFFFFFFYFWPYVHTAMLVTFCPRTAFRSFFVRVSVFVFFTPFAQFELRFEMNP